MPLNVDPSQIQGVTTRLNVDLTPRSQPVGLTDQLVSAMLLDNIPAAGAVRLAEEATLPSEPENERPFDLLEELTEEESFVASEFAGTSSRPELEQVRRRRRSEEEARRALGEGPLPAILASGLAVLADPTSYLPILGGLRIAGGTARAVGRAGAVSAAEVAATEAALQAMQETRTREESLAAVMLGGAFGMTVGGAAAALAGRRASEVERFLARASEDTATTMRATFPESTAGAAQVNRIDPADTELAGSMGAVRAARETLGRLKLSSVSLDVLSSPFGSARRSLLRLVDPGLVTKGVMRGVPNPQAVEIKVRRHDAVFADFNRALNALYTAHRKSGGRLSKVEFFEEIGRAARRGDEHSDAAVKAGAAEWRKVADRYKQAAQAEKLLPDDVSVATALSYLTRVYRRDRIKARRPEFKARIVQWLQEQAPKEDPIILRGVADDIINTILGSPDGRTQILGRIGGASPRARGPLKERTFNIPDALIEEFLESNVQVIGNRYIRTMAADIEVAREFGEVDPSGALKAEIRDEANALADAAKSDRERRRIIDEGRQAEAAIEEVVQNVRGVNGDMLDPRAAGWKQALRSARNLNFARLLGGVMISSIPDFGRIVMYGGVTRTLGPILADFGRGFRGVRLAKAEAQRAGTALDLYLSTRVKRMLDLGERYEAQTLMERVERASQSAANLAAQMTLINAWNTTMKSVTSMVVGTRILEVSRKLARGEAVSKGDRMRLARAGISEAMARRFADQGERWSEFGSGVGRVLIANADQWADREAADVFLNALVRDVDDAIITPGTGDAPLWTSREWGKSIFQFKKFASASTQRILISGLQVRDMAALNGILMMVGLGALGTALRDVASQGEVRERNGRAWAVDAVDRSGVFSMLYEGDALMEKFAGASPLTSLAGQEVSRFAGREALSQLLGPTAGLVTDAGGTATGILRGDMTQSDLHRLRRLAPFQNVFYLNWMFDQMESGVSSAFGLPARQPRRRRVAPPEFGG